MPMLGFGGDYSPYYYNVDPSSRLVPVAEGSFRPVANGTSTAGSQIDPLLGVARVSRFDTNVGADQGGVERMIARYNGQGRHNNNILIPNVAMLQASEQPPSSSAASAKKEPSTLLEKSSGASPKRRRSPCRKRQQLNEDNGKRSSSACAAHLSNDVKRRASAVVLTPDHYELLTEHHANLINELQETELMMSVYEQQLSRHSTETEAFRRQHQNSRKERPSSSGKSAGIAKKEPPNCKKKRG